MAFDFAKYQDELLFVPLGGSNEIGMNLNLYTYKGKWIMVDCGIGFANDHLPGIEIIVPDISFVAEIKKNLMALVITHAHEDHLGAVPYLWDELGCPIYATPFTAHFLAHKLSESGPGRKPKIVEMKPGSLVDLDPFKLELIELTHSIPEMQAVAITTPKGVIMHTGDWKFDEDPLIGPASNYDMLKKYGDGKVLAMVCDSTNVFVEGESGSESEVREHLVKLISECQRRVVVTTFASNLARVATIIMAAQQAGRVVALAGRSLHRVVAAAKECGYLSNNAEFINEREIGNVPKQDVLVLCTGCQGEPRAALTRIARGEHANIRLTPGDTVIFSSRKIPGNESKISHIVNRLVQGGIEVITEKDHFIHVSGHPAREELKRMYEMVRPLIAVPTHGEPRHLHEHAKLARSLGVAETVEAYNGAIVLLEQGESAVIGKVQAGYVAIDGTSLISTDGEVIRTRRKLRDDGAIFASVVLNKSGDVKAPIQLAAPGLLDSIDDKELLAEWCSEIDAILGQGKRTGDEQIKEQVRLALRKIIKQELDKKPVIEVAVSRI
jgi:ribonuclease J